MLLFSIGNADTPSPPPPPLPSQEHVSVKQVLPGLEASLRGGIKRGHIITAVDGADVSEMEFPAVLDLVRQRSSEESPMVLRFAKRKRRFQEIHGGKGNGNGNGNGSGNGNGNGNSNGDGNGSGKEADDNGG